MSNSRSRSLPLVLAAARERELQGELRPLRMDAHPDPGPGRANLQVCPTYLPVHGQDFLDSGFTLIELLVVIAITAFLAATLLPALAASKASTKADQCMANTRQLELAWAMYASDDHETLVSSSPGVNGWVQGTIRWYNIGEENQDNTLLVGPRPSGDPEPALGEYLKNPRVFKDPADSYQTAASGYRNRSYSMNGALGAGSGPIVEGSAPSNRKYYGNDPNHISLGRNAVNLSDLIHPAMVFVILDEQADSINDGKFMFNPGGGPGSSGPEKWRDLPASYHNGAGCFSFADGHSVVHHWQDRRTIFPVTYQNYVSATSPWGSISLIVSPDYEWMDDHMPYR